MSSFCRYSLVEKVRFSATDFMADNGDSPAENATKSKILTQIDLAALEHQNSRLVTEYKASQLEINVQKYWDLFYKRNETRFFKDRHWTTREFNELLNDSSVSKKCMLEIGCGVGNLIYPLVENTNFFIYACDLSERACKLVIENTSYNPNRMIVFQTDITTEQIYQHVKEDSLDIITMVFVLSAIHPDKFRKVFENAYKLLKPGGCVLFRDYGLYDMAQIRFKVGHKISDNFYMRQDGTRSYYFSTEIISHLISEVGFKTSANIYIHRRTVNKKEGLDVPRIFIQGKFVK